MVILEGKTLAAKIRESLSPRVQRVRQALNRPARLIGISWQGDYAGYLYLTKEVKAARALGMRADIVELDENTTPKDFIMLLGKVYGDENIDALLIPRPLPPALNDLDIAPLINPAQDIDGASLVSMGRLFMCKTWQQIKNLKTFVPCCPLAVMRLLEYHKIDLEGKNIAVIGRSNTVGGPLAKMLTCANATITLCHTKTKDLKDILLSQDIIISATGNARFIKAAMIAKNAIVIDVGTNLDENGKLCGDCDFEAISQNNSISPVPGGVGPLTLANLLEILYYQQRGK
ncbi:MAG: bifunctional 5,10-methylenetetrahydrofolate dehydrogenase/5,10-methenyltetrahydrofolate cyclohydrolase [Elusimicrobiaceae bacterium]|nr:bifunctional 5,10-methylenetetrahydrofolate dehydrogenase/5,10-methenyltetrahydrofolate cyclohydrolase [Elusimicrobiaceae bacterium]